MADSLLAQIELLDKVSGDPNGTKDGDLGTLVLATDGTGPWKKTTASGTLTGWVDVSAGSGGGGGAVDSVNGETGAVVLNPDHLDDSATTNKFTTAADIAKLATIEASATADQTGTEIVAAIDTELGQTTWKTGGGGGGTTNLGYTAAASGGTVTSDTGTDASVPDATTNAAGLLSATDKTKLNGIETGATADQSGSEIVSSINSELGGTSWQSGGAGNTDLSVVESPGGVEIQSSSGNNDTIALADSTNAGAYPPGHFDRIARAIAPTQTLVSSASMTIDADTGLNYNLEIDHSAATLTINNAEDGDVISIRVLQGTTGGDISSINVGATAVHIKGSFSSTTNDIQVVQIQIFGPNMVAHIGSA